MILLPHLFNSCVSVYICKYSMNYFGLYCEISSFGIRANMPLSCCLNSENSDDMFSVFLREKNRVKVSIRVEVSRAFHQIFR